MHEDNCFITLTYDDENIPWDGSLNKQHFQAFMKRLRWHNKEKKIRYFHVGEYGEQLSRPHYHALIFNHDFDDKETVDSERRNEVIHLRKITKNMANGIQHNRISDLGNRCILQSVHNEKNIGSKSRRTLLETNGR